MKQWRIRIPAFRHVALPAVLVLLVQAPAETQRSIPQLFPPRTTPRPTDAAFDLLETFPGIDGALAAISPDMTIAAGWGTLVVARNVGVAIIRKPFASEPARVVAQMRMSEFLARVTAPSERISDPTAMFDAESGRFFVVNAAQGDCPAPGQCSAHIQIAVSKTPYPETLTDVDWHFYALDRTLERTGSGVTATDNEGDFDHVALVGDKVVIGWQAANAHPTGTEGVGRGGRVRVLDKQPLLGGKRIETWLDFITPERPRPSVMHDARDRAEERDRAFFDVQTKCNTATAREAWVLGAVIGLQGTPRFDVRQVDSPFPCAVSTLVAPQPGGPPIDVIHWSTQPAYRDGRLWLVGLTGRDFGSGPVSAILWAEVDVRGWPDARVLQSGVFGEDRVWSYGPGFTVDAMGNLVIVYARSGPNDFASSYYTGRLATDPPGVLRPGQPLKTGTMTYVAIQNGRNRFIDYSWATVDPVDGSVWMLGLVPVPGPGGNPWSDAWVGRVRPLDALGGNIPR